MKTNIALKIALGFINKVIERPLTDQRLNSLRQACKHLHSALDDTPFHMTPKQVAERFQVSPVTVRQWAQRGLIESITTPGGHRRFSPEAVEHLARRVKDST